MPSPAEKKQTMYQTLQSLWAGEKRSQLKQVITTIMNGKPLQDDDLEMTELLTDKGILNKKFVGFLFKNILQPRIGFRYTFADSDLIHSVFQGKGDNLEFICHREECFVRRSNP